MTLSERKAGMPPPVLVVALRNRYVLERELGAGVGTATSARTSLDVAR